MVLPVNPSISPSPRRSPEADSTAPSNDGGEALRAIARGARPPIGAGAAAATAAVAGAPHKSDEGYGEEEQRKRPLPQEDANVDPTEVGVRRGEKVGLGLQLLAQPGGDVLAAPRRERPKPERRIHPERAYAVALSTAILIEIGEGHGVDGGHAIEGSPARSPIVSQQVVKRTADIGGRENRGRVGRLGQRGAGDRPGTC